MSPPDTRKARATLLQLAGRMKARRDEKAAAVTALERDPAAGEAAHAAALDAARAELAAADKDLADTLAEFDALAGAEKDAERAALRAAIQVTPAGDPLSDSPVDRALAAARENLGNLEARVALDRDLAAARTSATTPVEQQEDPEARARRQLAELKARRKGGGA